MRSLPTRRRSRRPLALIVLALAALISGYVLFVAPTAPEVTINYPATVRTNQSFNLTVNAGKLFQATKVYVFVYKIGVTDSIQTLATLGLVTADRCGPVTVCELIWHVPATWLSFQRPSLTIGLTTKAQVGEFHFVEAKVGPETVERDNLHQYWSRTTIKVVN